MLKSKLPLAFCLKAICSLLISCPDIYYFKILIDYNCGKYHVCTLSNIFSFSSLVFIQCGCLCVTFPFLCLTQLSCVKDLKDFMRQAGEVTFADAHRPKLNEG